jgi:hypothetical protein
MLTTIRDPDGQQAQSSAFSYQSGAALLQQASLAYQGFFLLPTNAHSGGSLNAGFDYGGTGLCFNPANSSLFIVGHDTEQRTAEVPIPALGTRVALSALISPLTDAFEGKRPLIGTTYSGNKPSAVQRHDVHRCIRLLRCVGRASPLPLQPADQSRRDGSGSRAGPSRSTRGWVLFGLHDQRAEHVADGARGAVFDGQCVLIGD